MTGQITNFEYENQSPYSKDLAVKNIDDYIWSFYSDFKEHKLPKGCLPETTKKEFARIILFLNSDNEYEWPPEPNLLSKLKKLLTSNEPLKGLKVRRFDYHNAGDLSVWPFTHRKHMMAEAEKRRVGLSLKLAQP